MNNYIQPLKEIPAKSEIGVLVEQYKKQEGLSDIEKYANLKFLEEFVKKGLVELKEPAKDDFIKMFNGATSMDFMGITVSLKNMTKSNRLKDPSYEYPQHITGLVKDIEAIELILKGKKDMLKLLKTQSINEGTAKKLDEIFEEPKELKDDFQLTITLRK